MAWPVPELTVRFGHALALYSVVSCVAVLKAAGFSQEEVVKKLNDGVPPVGVDATDWGVAGMAEIELQKTDRFFLNLSFPTVSCRHLCRRHLCRRRCRCWVSLWECWAAVD